MRSASLLIAFVAAVCLASTARAQNVFSPVPGTSPSVFVPVAPPGYVSRGGTNMPSDLNSPNDRKCTSTAWEYTVPAGVNWLRITATGGMGTPTAITMNLEPRAPARLGVNRPSGGTGLGATVQGIIPVTPGQKLYVLPASNGGAGSHEWVDKSGAYHAPYGWGFPNAGVGNRPGGGASLVSTIAAVRPPDDGQGTHPWCYIPPANLLVAAGGGGGEGQDGASAGMVYIAGGSGGSAGLVSETASAGGNGSGPAGGGGGGGGSQTAGGAVGTHPDFSGSEARSDGFYLLGSNNGGLGGAGGAGYYGGGGGGGCGPFSGSGGGGGGSSWITPTAQQVQAALDGTASPGVIIEPMAVSYPMNVAITGTGTVTSSDSTLSCSKPACTAYEAENASVTFTAVAGANSAFQGWAGDCSSAGMSLTCTLKSGPLVGTPQGGFYPRTAAARFGAVALYQLTVSFSSSNPANTGLTVNYGTSKATVAANQTLTLQLPANTAIQIGGVMMTSPYQLQVGQMPSTGKLPLAFPLTAATNVSVTSTIWQP